MFLGIDGGGTKTAYVLIHGDGSIRASHVGGSVSYLSEGFARAGALLIEGIGTTLAKAVAGPGDLTFAFVGLPAYGEDSATTSQLDAMPSALIDATRYRAATT